MSIGRLNYIIAQGRYRISSKRFYTLTNHQLRFLLLKTHFKFLENTVFIVRVSQDFPIIITGKFMGVGSSSYIEKNSKE